jgi:hypothetical protein
VRTAKEVVLVSPGGDIESCSACYDGVPCPTRPHPSTLTCQEVGAPQFCGLTRAHCQHLPFDSPHRSEAPRARLSCHQNRRPPQSVSTASGRCRRSTVGAQRDRRARRRVRVKTAAGKRINKRNVNRFPKAEISVIPVSTRRTGLAPPAGAWRAEWPGTPRRFA